MSDGDERGTSERPSEPSNTVSDGDERGTSERPSEREQAGAETSQAAPVLRIITPDTTPEEVAAIVAVFASLGGEQDSAPKPARTWASVARRIGAASPARPGSWRTSALPR